MGKGTVKFFNAAKGFGMIAPEDGSDDLLVLAAASDVMVIKVLKEGMRVVYEVTKTRKGLEASNVQLMA